MGTQYQSPNSFGFPRELGNRYCVPKCIRNNTVAVNTAIIGRNMDDQFISNMFPLKHPSLITCSIVRPKRISGSFVHSIKTFFSFLTKERFNTNMNRVGLNAPINSNAFWVYAI